MNVMLVALVSQGMPQETRKRCDGTLRALKDGMEIEMKKAFVGLVALMNLAACGADEPVEIRFVNAFSENFESLEVDFGGRTEFGALKTGERTDYKPFYGAYEYGYIRVVAGGQEYVAQPFDYVGETPLARGRYTYQITLTAPPQRRVAGRMQRDQ